MNDLFDTMIDNEEMWFYYADENAIQIINPQIVYFQMEDC